MELPLMHTQTHTLSYLPTPLFSSFPHSQNVAQRFYLGIGDAGRETRLQYSAGENRSRARDVITCPSWCKLAL